MFVAFFGVGAAALGCSILAKELLGYYKSEQLLAAANESLDRLKSLNEDYDVLLKQLEEDPNLYKRIGPATLGTKLADANVVYPRAKAENLDAARKALTEDGQQQRGDLTVPKWLTRCNRPYHRMVLFGCGAVLVIISFVCFGTNFTKDRQRTGALVES